MKKIVNINEVIAKVKAATTEDAIKAVLEGCTKETIVRLSMRTHEKVLSLRIKKVDMIKRFVSDEMSRREDEAFRALSVEEKIKNCAGKGYYDNIHRITLCTDTELGEMAEILGAELDADKLEISHRYALQSGVNKALVKAHYKTASTPEALKEMLEGFTREQIAELFNTVFAPALMLDETEKEEMIDIFIKTEMRARDIATFKSLNVEGKIRKLVDIEGSELSYYFNACTYEEVLEIGSVFGIEKADRNVLEFVLTFRFEELKKNGGIDELFSKETSYEAVKAAYCKFEIADNDYYEKGTAELKAVRDASYEEYRRVLAEYTEKPSPQKDEVRAELIRKYGNSEHTLSHLKSINKRTLVEMSHKAGIHADYVETPAQDVAVRLLRWAGIDCEAETYAEQAEREYREEINWLNARIEQKRAEYLGLVEALRVLEGSKNYGALLALKGKVQQEYREVRLESWQYRREHDAKEQKAA